MEPVAHVNTLYMLVLYLIIHPPKDSFIIISHLLLRAVFGVGLNSTAVKRFPELLLEQEVATKWKVYEMKLEK